MRINAGWVVLCAVGLGCGSKWEFQDQDGDGISAAEGDCWDQAEGPEGSGLTGDQIFPDAEEVWYDGFDQDCAGDDDFDADKDGFVPDEYLGEETMGQPESGLLPAGDCWDAIEGPEGVEYGGAEIFPGASDSWYDGVDQDCGADDDYDADTDGFVPSEYAGLTTVGTPGSGELPGGDCWDDPSTSPADMQVVSEGDWSQPKARQVHPDAQDEWYDGVDQDCAGDDDFDQDGDGSATMHFPNRDGDPAGTDCVDRAEDLEVGIGLDSAYVALLEEDNPEVIAPENIYVGAPDDWYDGVDSNCDLADDCDQDEDGYGSPGLETADCAESGLRPCCDVGEDVDCDDEDAARYPNDDVVEIYFNGVDDNCNAADGDGDQDGDGWWASNYLDKVDEYAAAHPDEEVTAMEIPDGYSDDCVDDPDDPALTSDVDASGIHPGAIDLAYNGFDEGCEGDDDFDDDDDGQVYDNHVGLTTYPLLSSGDLDGGDCDDTDATIYTGAPDDWYDGVDSDCAGNEDYDADGDRYVPDVYDGEPTHPWDTDDPPYDFGDGALALDPAVLDRLPAGDCEDGEDYAEVFDGTLFTGADIYPGADDVWYDGVDSDCDYRDDYDQDEDTYVTDAHVGLSTYPGDGSDLLDGGDCDDEDADFRPGAPDIWYDGRDTNCDERVDYDQDDDGYVPDEYVGLSTYPVEDSAGLPGNDCDDTRADMNPSITDVWYDGDDANCDGADDYDQDGDGYVEDAYVGLPTHPIGTSGSLLGGDCLDTDASFRPGAPDSWYDGEDTNCEGDDDYDRDGDGYVRDGDGGRTTFPGDFGGGLPDGDCDDTNSAVNPGVNEDCGTTFTDDNCDGSLELIDAEDCTDWHMDGDGDGYGDPSDTQCSCDPIGDYNTEVDTDCDDSRSDTFPGAAEFEPGLCAKDSDNDGYGDEDTGPWDEGSDCDDSVLSTYPGAPETCDSVDSDCDDDFNDQNSLGCDTFFRDFDGDGYGDPTRSRCYCEESGSYSSFDSTDCDDGSASTYPGAPETCDGIDSDCDLTDNDPGASGCDDMYVDSDGDGYGDPSLSACLCSATATYEVEDGSDCDDGAAAINPGADEICDGLDNDCDLVTDDPSAVDAETWTLDSDGDGYGDPATAYFGCDPEDGSETDLEDDCDDSEPDINPGADEICDGEDNDCDTEVDEDDAVDATTWYGDDDDDGYGEDDDTQVSCDPPTGYTDLGGDCDDADEDINPGMADYSDGIDEDCDEYVDEDEIFDLLAADPSADILSLSEIQINPYGGEPGNEWFEVYNASGMTLYLDGWSITRTKTSGSSATHTLYISPGPGLSVEPDEYLVFCARNGTGVGLGAICDYYYAQSGYYSTSSRCGDPVNTGFYLRNNTDFDITIGLYETDCTTATSSDFVEIDHVDFTAFNEDEGESLELAHEYVTGGSGVDDNDDKDNYCSNETDVYTGSTDMSTSGGLQSNTGTPGADNTCVIADL